MPNKSDLKKAGLKTTLPRLRILEILEKGTQRHLTAEDVYKQLLDAGEEMSLATVYRVLTQFQTAGLILRHNFEGGRSIFELNDEEHHDHMVCLECGRVFEFFDKEIERRQREAAKAEGFLIDDHALYLYGTCEGMKESGKCSREGKKKPRKEDITR